MSLSFLKKKEIYEFFFLNFNWEDRGVKVVKAIQSSAYNLPSSPNLSKVGLVNWKRKPESFSSQQGYREPSVTKFIFPYL